jgi:hypothetical protein
MSANCHGSKLNKKMIVVLRQVRKVVPEQIQEKNIWCVTARWGTYQQSGTGHIRKDATCVDD